MDGEQFWSRIEAVVTVNGGYIEQTFARNDTCLEIIYKKNPGLDGWSYIYIYIYEWKKFNNPHTDGFIKAQNFTSEWINPVLNQRLTRFYQSYFYCKLQTQLT